MKGLALTPTEQAAHCLQRIEKCLTISCSSHRAKQFNEYLHWMYLNGGPDVVANWCFQKLINQGDGIDEIKLYRIKVFIKKYSAWAVADAAVQAKELEMKDVINAHKRADNMNALQQRATIEWNRNEHPFAAVKRRLEQSLRLNEAPKAIVPPIAPSQRHSTRQIGECGKHIGEKIDAILWLHAHYEDEADWPNDEPLGLDQLLLEIQTEPDTHAELALGIPRAELIQTATDQVAPPVVIAASAAPPSPQGAGEQSADASAAVGGCSGFTNDHGTAWDAFSGRPDCANDISDFLIEIDENPRLRASANLRTLSRVRDEMDRIPESASLGDPVVLRLQDVLLLMSQVTSRLR